jgi:integrase
MKALIAEDKRWPKRTKTTKKWRVQIYTGESKVENGKRVYQRVYDTVIGTKDDAENKAGELVGKIGGSDYVQPAKMTVGQHLQSWLSGYVATKRPGRTHDGYESIIRNHLQPAFGNLKLKDLTWQRIQSFYAQSVGAPTEGKHSARSIRHWNAVLSESLTYAVKKGYVANNQCSLCDLPEVKEKDMRTLTAEEAIRLEKASNQSYYWPIIYSALSTGLRQAEIAALRWRDLNLTGCTISVNRSLYIRHGVPEFKEPKTKRSRRSVAMTPKLAIFLRQYKAHREAVYLETGKVLSQDDLVFTSVDFKPLNPSVITHNFQRIAARSGIKGIRFHDLRHTFASLTLSAGVPPKVISEALGHASVAFTMDVYSHTIKGMQEDAMRILDGVLPASEIHDNSRQEV